MMGGTNKRIRTVVALTAAVMAVAYASQAWAGDGADPFGAWSNLESQELQQSRGGTDGGDDIDIGSHNVNLTNDNDLTTENSNNSISVGNNATATTGFASTVAQNNRGFTTVISNTGNQNNFLSNYTVNLYLK